MNEHQIGQIQGLAFYYTVTSAAKEVLRTKKVSSQLVSVKELVEAMADMYFDVILAFGAGKSTSEIEAIYAEHELIIHAVTDGL